MSSYDVDGWFFLLREGWLLRGGAGWWRLPGGHTGPHEPGPMQGLIDVLLMRRLLCLTHFWRDQNEGRKQFDAKTYINTFHFKIFILKDLEGRDGRKCVLTCVDL